MVPWALVAAAAAVPALMTSVGCSPVSSQSPTPAPVVAEQQIRIGVATSNPEIEALEVELVRIQRRLDELRSNTRP